jgi:hypothetical protein
MSIVEPLSAGVFEWPCQKPRAMELRPLDLGEIFDRAITLYVRNFRAFAGIVFVTVVPVAIVQYFLILHELPELNTSLALLAHPERLGTQHVPTMFDSPATLALWVVSALVAYVTTTIALSAVGVGVARVYYGRPVDFAACYEPVLHRWRSLLALLGAALAMLIVAYVAAILLMMIPIAIGVLSARSGFPVVLVLAVTVMLFAVLFAVLLVFITSAFGFYGVVIESLPAFASLRLAFARVFNRNDFGRALLCSIAVGVLWFASTALFDSFGFVALARWPSAYVTLDALVRIVVLPFIGVILALFYFDVRIRNEGFDLEVEMERPSGLPGEGDEPNYAPTAYLSGPERAMIKRFLERRDSLTVHRRQEIAAQLAAPLRERVPAEMRRLGDESLLERL